MSLDTSINIIDLATLKTYLNGNTSSSTEYDARWEEIINDVSQYFNSYCGRIFKASTYTSDYDGNGTSELKVYNYPISSTTITVCIDGTRSFTTDYNVDSTAIILYQDEGRLCLEGSCFSEGKKNVRIAYTGGYSSSAMPYDLRRAAKEYAVFLWKRESKTDMIGIRNESLDGGSRTFETELPWSVKKILDNYRNYVY